MRILLSLVAGFLLLTWVGSAVAYADLPDRIPVHFGLSGQPDRWADKSFWSVFTLPLVATVIGALLGTLAVVAARKPGVFNFPGKEDFLALPPERRQPATRVLQEMMAALALATVALFAVIQLAVLRAGQLGQEDGLVLPAVLVTVVAMPVLIGVYSLRINRAVREAAGRAR